MNWRVYYSDDWIITSEDIKPEEIKRRSGVQVILVHDNERGWRAIAPADFYLWELREGDQAPCWYPANIHDLTLYLLRPGLKCILFGEYINRKRYNEILERALKDRSLPAKTTWGKEERHD